MNSICSVASEHKTRVLNVFWKWLQLFITVAIVAHLDARLEKHECGQNGKVLRQLAFTGSIAFVILLTGGLVYVGFRKRFARLEFFILYVIQATWNTIMLAYSIWLLIKGSGCSMLFLLEKTLIVLIIKTEFEVQCIMWLPKPLAFLHNNVSTNILWPILFLTMTSAKCAKSNTTLVLGITFFTLFFSMMSLAISVANVFVKDMTRLKRATFFFYFLTAFISGGLILAAHSEKAEFAAKKNESSNCRLFHVQMGAYLAAEPLNFLGLVFICLYSFSNWEKGGEDDYPDLKSLKFVQEIPSN